MKLRVNGQSLEVPDGSTVLQAARLAGVEVPTLCHDDRLKPAGACVSAAATARRSSVCSSTRA